MIFIILFLDNEICLLNRRRVIERKEKDKEKKIACPFTHTHIHTPCVKAGLRRLLQKVSESEINVKVWEREWVREADRRGAAGHSHPTIYTLCPNHGGIIPPWPQLFHCVLL